MVAIRVETDRAGGDLSLVTFAESEDQIGPGAINALIEVFGFSSGKPLTYVPAVADFDDLETGYKGEIKDSGQYPINCHVYTVDIDNLQNVIVSGHFINIHEKTRTVTNE